MSAPLPVAQTPSIAMIEIQQAKIQQVYKSWKITSPIDKQKKYTLAPLFISLMEIGELDAEKNIGIMLNLFDKIGLTLFKSKTVGDSQMRLEVTGKQVEEMAQTVAKSGLIFKASLGDLKDGS